MAAASETAHRPQAYDGYHASTAYEGIEDDQAFMKDILARVEGVSSRDIESTLVGTHCEVKVLSRETSIYRYGEAHGLHKPWYLLAKRHKDAARVVDEIAHTTLAANRGAAPPTAGGKVTIYGSLAHVILTTQAAHCDLKDYSVTLHAKESDEACTLDAVIRPIVCIAKRLLKIYTVMPAYPDLKPENVVWMKERDDFFLIDFEAIGHTDFGTDPYRDPDALAFFPVSSHELLQRKNVWQIGVIFMELLTGEIFTRSLDDIRSREHIHGRIESLLSRKLSPELRPYRSPIQYVISQALERTRFTRMDLSRTLDQVVQHLVSEELARELHEKGMLTEAEYRNVLERGPVEQVGCHACAVM